MHTSHSEPSVETDTKTGLSAKIATAIQAVAAFIRRHPKGVLQSIFGLLVLIVILQNWEPTEVTILFWRIAEVPKLVLFVLMMVLGAVSWEIIKRVWHWRQQKRAQQ